MHLVATYNFGDLSYAALTVPYMRAYAERVGADFIEYKHFPNRDYYPTTPGWFHVEAMRLFHDQCYYDTLLLLDADQLVLPHCPNVFELVDDRLAVVQDMGRPHSDDRYRQWCRTQLHEEPVEGAYFNAGMLLVPLAAVRRLWQRLAGPYPAGCDQDFLNQRVRAYDEVTWLPQEFNWLAPQFREASLSKNIVHFVGGHKEELPAFLSHVCFPPLRPDQPSRHKTLAELGRHFRTDKGTDHSYLEFYEQLFAPLRHEPIELLEIGVKDGESLKLWRTYFSRARITGLDIHLNGANVAGCQLVEGSQSDRLAIEQHWPDQQFDIIIDDGSHRLEEQLLAVCYFWPKLRPGGHYIIEDISEAAFIKYFAAFRPLVLDRRQRRHRSDDIVVVLAK